MNNQPPKPPKKMSRLVFLIVHQKELNATTDAAHKRHTPTKKTFRQKINGKVNAYKIAALLNLAPSTAYQKLKNNTFTYDEMLAIQKQFFPNETIDTLFRYI